MRKYSAILFLLSFCALALAGARPTLTVTSLLRRGANVMHYQDTAVGQTQRHFFPAFPIPIVSGPGAYSVNNSPPGLGGLNGEVDSQILSWSSVSSPPGFLSINFDSVGVGRIQTGNNRPYALANSYYWLEMDFNIRGGTTYAAILYNASTIAQFGAEDHENIVSSTIKLQRLDQPSVVFEIKANGFVERERQFMGQALPELPPGNYKLYAEQKCLRTTRYLPGVNVRSGTSGLLFNFEIPADVRWKLRALPQAVPLRP